MSKFLILNNYNYLNLAPRTGTAPAYLLTFSDNTVAHNINSFPMVWRRLFFRVDLFGASAPLINNYFTLKFMLFYRGNGIIAPLNTYAVPGLDCYDGPTNYTPPVETPEYFGKVSQAPVLTPVGTVTSQGYRYEVITKHPKIFYESLNIPVSSPFYIDTLVYLIPNCPGATSEANCYDWSFTGIWITTLAEVD
jgi:hypothetical protein